MTDYGPWIVHTPGECPVPPETRMQWLTTHGTLAEAESHPPKRADYLDWAHVRFYRVLLEPEWATMFLDTLDDIVVPIRIPMLDGDFDYSRQPEWVV